MRILKRIVFTLMLAGLVVLLAFVFRPKPLAVETSGVTRGPLEVTIDEDGETRARERYTLASPVAGQMSRIDLHEGDQVNTGTPIATITPLPVDPREEAELEAQIQSTEALQLEAGKQVARRASDHDQAQRDLNRAQALAKDKIISRQVLEQAQTAEAAAAKELEAAEFREKSAAADVKRAEAGLISLAAHSKRERAVILRPPSPGRILRILEKSERVVAAGTPLLVLSNPRRIEVIVDLLSTDAVKVPAGAPVWIENWGGPAPLRGKVRLVEPYGYTKISALGVEEQRVDVIIDFIDSPKSLGDGFRVDARIVIWQCADVVKAPVSALFRSGDAWSVFSVQNGRAVRRLVEVGHRNAVEAEITRGLSSGIDLILHPSTEVKEGIRVTKR